MLTLLSIYPLFLKLTKINKLNFECFYFLNGQKGRKIVLFIRLFTLNPSEASNVQEQPAVENLDQEHRCRLDLSLTYVIATVCDSFVLEKKSSILPLYTHI